MIFDFSVPILTCTLAWQLPLAVGEAPALPPPPLLHSLLLESPGAWFTAFALLIAGIALLTRTSKKMRLVGVVIVLAGVAVGVLQQVVVTEREALITRSREAVMAVAGANERAMSELLTANFKATYKDAPQGLNRQETISQAKARFAAQPPEVSIGEMQAVADNERFGRSTVRLTGKGEQSYGVPLTLVGVLNWEKIDGEWKLSSVELTMAPIPGIKGAN